MKHYSADLNSNSSVDAAGRLHIETARPKGADITALDDTIDGFVILAGDDTHILDAQGSEFDPNVSTTASQNIINITRDVQINATTSELHFYFDTDDVGIATDAAPVSGRGFTVDLSVIGGGGTSGSADTNPTTNYLPVKTTYGATNDFIDSQIQESGTVGYLNLTGLASTSANTTTATFTGAAIIADALVAGQTVVVSSADAGPPVDFDTFAGTVMANSTTGSVTITFGTAPTFTAGQIAAGFAITRNLVADTVTIGNSSSVKTIVNGDLEVKGATTYLDTTNTLIEDQYIHLGEVQGQGDKTAADIGILALVDKNGATNNYQGIRYNEGSDAWEVSSATAGVTLTNGVPSDDTQWTAISTHAGTVSKGVVSIASIAANGAVGAISGSYNGTATASAPAVVTNPAAGATDLTITISTASPGNLPFASDDLTVQIFEGANQILAKEVAVNAANIVVSLPNGYANTGVTKVVIIG